MGVLLLSFFLVFLPFAGRETSDGLEAVLQIIAMAETAGVGYGLKFVVFVFNQHTLASSMRSSESHTRKVFPSYTER